MKQLNFIIAIIAIAIMAVALASCSPSANTEPGACETKEDALVDEAKEADALLCTVEELRQMSEKDKKYKADLIKVYKHLRFKDEVAYFDMTKQQAENEGIDIDLYYQMVQATNNMNEAINQWKKDGEEINLEIPENILDIIDTRPKKNNLQILTKGLSTSTYAFGNLNTIDQDEARDYFQPQENDKAVLFRCRANATPASLFYCSVSVFGETKIASGACGVVSFTETLVPVAAYGCGLVATVSFRTTDSYGGMCSWFSKPSVTPGGDF